MCASVSSWAIKVDCLMLGIVCNIILIDILDHPPIKVIIEFEEFGAKRDYRIPAIACQQPDSGTFIEYEPNQKLDGLISLEIKVFPAIRIFLDVTVNG